jgi:hypothetical protein
MENEEDYYTAAETARILELTGGRVRQMLSAGEIEGALRDDGGRWLIPQYVVHAMLEQRRLEERQSPRRGKAIEQSSEAPETSAERREMQIRLEDLQRHLGRLEGRLELEAVAQSTLKESLDRERQRADAMELEAKELRQRLEEAQKPWWRKLFGG